MVSATHTKLNKNKANYLILLHINSGEEVVIQKSCTIALGVKSKWKVRGKLSNHYNGAPPLLRWQVNKLVTHPEGNNKYPSVQKTLEETAFVGRHNTYTKPKVNLKDVKLFPALQREFKNLKEKYKDIFSMGPLDIGITDLSEMTIDTKEDAIPYTVRLYKLALQHQDFLRREIQVLLDAKIIVPSISQYAAPCMVVPQKCRDPSMASIREVARLVIN